ncbi:homoserine dehydrogenase [Salinicola halophilus]|uniref:homoserine dehydrogenase n=1 Tax=Salinicola halophilus TaxID=184065 RepID=UPI000DA14FBE|nr:homoserine dehydrogenase [Salinicola halophilus]
MNFEAFFTPESQPVIGMAIVGARGGFGYSLLAQCRHIDKIRVVALCDLQLEALENGLQELGYGVDEWQRCDDAESAARAAAAGRIVLCDDYRLLEAVALDVVVEATGHPDTSAIVAQRSLERGVHVAMATKEVDSVIGPWLSRLAERHGVVYSTVEGDQPGNLVGLFSWGRMLGFDIVAAGKSSEYDYVYDPASGRIRYTDREVAVSSLGDAMTLGGDVAETLDRRRKLLAMLPQSATPDYCEMTVAANSLGFRPACETMNYPLCRVAELADVFIPRADGGILDGEGVVDVFNCLRLPEEASFGGGVFIVVRCQNREVWRVLAEKGHVVSRNGDYACLFWPYHLMGLETPMTLYAMVWGKRPSGGVRQRTYAVMAGEAQRDFCAGETLAMGGHHHVIEDLEPRLLSAGQQTRELAPFYLAANRRLIRDVKKGDKITIEDLDLSDSPLFDAYRALQTEGLVAEIETARDTTSDQRQR